MGKKLKNFLEGVGGILQIAPSAPSVMVRPHFLCVSDSQRLASDWDRVGLHLHRAIDREANGVRVNGQTK